LDRKAAEQKFMSKMGKVEYPGFHDGWCETARNVTAGLFPEGWDKNWLEYVNNISLPKNSCVDGPDAYGDFAGSLEYETYWKWAKGEVDIGLSARRKVVGVPDGSKVRVVTLGDSVQAVLSPLHSIIYDVLSKCRWLNRGEVTAADIQGRFDRVPGQGEEVFVSGDYEAATDNFNVDHSEYLLACLQATSRFIPDTVWRTASDHLCGVKELFVGKSTEVRTLSRKGQLMGDYLSFPLLCLTNYLTFINALGQDGFRIAKSGLLLINGDDILFRTTRGNAERWMNGVAEGGLTVSRGKTLTHARFMSLNSHFFYCSFRKSGAERRVHVGIVPVVRIKTWSGKVEKDSKGRRVPILLGVMSRLEKVLSDAGQVRRVGGGLSRMFCARNRMRLREDGRFWTRRKEEGRLEFVERLRKKLLKQAPPAFRTRFENGYFHPAPSLVAEKIHYKMELVVADDVLGRDEVRYLKRRSAQLEKVMGWQETRRNQVSLGPKHKQPRALVETIHLPVSWEEATPRRARWPPGFRGKVGIWNGDAWEEESVRLVDDRLEKDRGQLLKRVLDVSCAVGPVAYQDLEAKLIYRPFGHGKGGVGYEADPRENDYAWVLPTVARTSQEARQVAKWPDPVFVRRDILPGTAGV